jgi:hypothetical protein
MILSKKGDEGVLPIPLIHAQERMRVYNVVLLRKQECNRALFARYTNTGPVRSRCQLCKRRAVTRKCAVSETPSEWSNRKVGA